MRKFKVKNTITMLPLLILALFFIFLPIASMLLTTECTGSYLNIPPNTSPPSDGNGTIVTATKTAISTHIRG